MEKGILQDITAYGGEKKKKTTDAGKYTACP